MRETTTGLMARSEPEGRPIVRTNGVLGGDPRIGVHHVVPLVFEARYTVEHVVTVTYPNLIDSDNLEGDSGTHENINLAPCLRDNPCYTGIQSTDFTVSAVATIELRSCEGGLSAEWIWVEIGCVSSRVSR